MESVYLNNIKEFSQAQKEAFRALKTNIQFCGDDVRTIMFTSGIPNEGKSTVTLSVAKSFSDAGKKVLFIDTDMRGSVLLGKVRAKSEKGKRFLGLSHYLSGQKGLEDIVYETQYPNLYMILAGPSVPNSTEILEKKYFEQLMEYAREHFDYVLLDCAPLGSVIDAAIVAKQCDGAVLVIGQGMAGSKIVVNAKKQLEAAGVRILGVVLNKVRQESHRYGKYYGKYHGRYHKDYYTTPKAEGPAQ